MKKPIILTFLLFFIFTSFSIELKLKFTKGEVLYIETNSILRQFVNGEYNGETKLKEVSYVSTKDIVNDTALLESTIYTLTEENIQNKKTYKVEKNFKYKYEKDQFGKTKNLEFQKGYHNFPQFEKKDIDLGTSWILPSFYNVKIFGDKTPMLTINFDVVYRLIDIKKIEDKNIAIISAKAIFTYEKNIELFKMYNIIKFIGFNDFLIEFNIDDGRVKRIEELFDYTYILQDKTLIETSGTSISEYEVPPPLKEDEIDRLKQKVENEKEKNKDITIELKKDKSLSISLENIQFKPDSAVLTEEELKRLDKIASILENYKSNKIIIIGHTADIGKPKEQQILSEKRAKVVLEYLVTKHNFNPELLSYQGKGGTEPISDNSTEEGRKRNRRVEIIILPK